MILVYLFMGLVGAAAAIFAIQNLRTVEVSFLVWRVEGMPLALVILLSAFVGIVIASASGLARHWKLRFRIRSLEKELAHLRAVEAQRSAAPPRPEPTRVDTPAH